MWQGVDKRRFPRANYPCKITVIKKGHTKKILTRTENIGIGGVCVVLEDELDRFSDVDLILALEDGSPPIYCDGRIVWTVKKITQFDTGIEFVNLKENDKIRIEKVVEECLQKQNP